jgi:ornithine cyclodeaminase/alanine dehydrogenase-like protein (mu-crystallin family)
MDRPMSSTDRGAKRSGRDRTDCEHAAGHRGKREAHLGQPNAVVLHECEQASHGWRGARCVEAGLLGRDDVTELGHVLLGEAGGRRSDDDVTAFDSTGLAIQDLAIALAALEAAPDDLPQIPV